MMKDKKQAEDRLSEVSDNYIRLCYQALKDAFKHDAGLTDEQKRQFQQFGQDGVYYGTDIFSDWTEWEKMLRREIERRGLDV